MRLGHGEAHDTHANEVIACCVVKRCQVAPCVVYGHRHGNYSGLSRLKRAIREGTEHCNFVYFCVVCVCVLICMSFAFLLYRTHTHPGFSGWPVAQFFCFFFCLSSLKCLLVLIDGGRFVRR
jgi:hypothetical protein